MLNIIHALGMTLLHFLWQGALVGIALWLLLFIIKRPQQRYVLACCSLLLLSILPVITYLNQPSTTAQPESVEAAPSMATPAPTVAPALLLPVQGNSEPIAPLALPENTAEQTSIAPVEAPRAWWQGWKLEPFLPYIVLAWLLGVLTFSLRLLGGYLWLRNLRARALEPANTALLEKLALLKKQLGIRLPVRLHHSDHVAVPMVMGIIKPIILLPSSSLIGLTMQQLETILAHELAHIQRHDYLVNMLQGICEALLFYHPVMWWVNRVIRHERELCCDDIAVRLTNQPKTYAHALSVLAHNSITTKTTTTMAKNLAPSATGGSMYQRIQRILKLPKQHSRPAIIGVISLALLAGLAFSLISAVQPQRTLHEQQKKPVLWVTFAGAINFDEDGFTVYSSPEQHSFFVIEEVTGQKRRFASDIVYDELRETRFNLTDLEPWLYEALNPVISHLPERSVTPVFSIRNRMQESSYDNYIIISYPTLQMSADYSDMWSRPGTVTSSDPDITIPQHILKIAQRSAHGLLNEDTVMHYLRNVATKHSRSWGNYPDTLEILIKTLTQAENRQEARALFGIADKAELEYLLALQPVDANSADDEALWITVVGDITLQNDNLTFSYDQRHKPFIVVEERAGQKRIFDSRDNYSNDGEYTLALAEFEPWLAQVLRDAFPKVLELQTKDHSSYLGNIASQEVRLMVITKRSKSEDMLSLQPAVRSYEEVFAELDLNEAQYANLITTSFGDMAQRRQHGLLVDQEVMTYLRTVAKRHNPLPLGTQESLDLLINSIDSEVFSEEARELFTFQEQALNSEPVGTRKVVTTALWLTFAGKFSFEDDGIVMHYSQENPSFFVIEERSETGRKYMARQDDAQTSDHFLPYEELEPWVQTIFQDFRYVLPRMQAATNLESPYRAAIDRQYEISQTRYEHVNIVMYSQPDGVATIYNFFDVEDIDLSDLSTFLLIRRDMAGIIQQRAHNIVSDAEVMAYLRNIQQNHSEIPQQLQADFGRLVALLDEELQADVLRGFSFVNIPLHNEIVGTLLFATFAGDMSFSGDGVTLRASSEQPAFLILEEVTGRKRRYEKRITYAQTDEARVRVRDVPRWAQEAFLEIIVGMPMNPSASYSTGNPSGYLDYQYWIKYVDSTAAIPAPYRDSWTDSPITERHLIGANHDIYDVLQYSMHGFLEDSTVLQYLHDAKEQNAENLVYFPTEIALLIDSIEDEVMRAEARALFSNDNQNETEATTLWLAFGGDIRSDATGFTLISSADMPSFFHLNELDNAKRSVGSTIDYSQSLETTFNFDDFEPWAAAILRETVASLEMTDEGMPMYNALLSYQAGKINLIDARTTVMPLDGVTEEVVNNGFAMNDWGITYYLYQLQENDASYLTSLEPYIKPLISAIQDEGSRILTEAIYISDSDDAIQADEVWFTVVGDVRFDRDTIILNPSAEQEAFFVVEERGGQGRSFRADSGAAIRRLAMRELEPWLREFLTFDKFFVNITMKDADTINLYRTVHHEEPARPPTRFVIAKDMNALEPLETETLTHSSATVVQIKVKESLTEAIQRKKHGVLSDAAALDYLARLQEIAHITKVAPEKLEQFLHAFEDDAKRAEARAILANVTISNPYHDFLTLYEQPKDQRFIGAATQALETVLDYRSQGIMPDAMLLQYLREVQLGNPTLPHEAQPLIEALLTELDTVSQAEVTDFFNYADMNKEPEWLGWNPDSKPQLWLTLAGDFAIDDDGITLYSSPEQPSFLVVEEITGQQRRYSPTIAYDQVRETRIALHDMDTWVTDALKNILIMLPERPSAQQYANLEPQKDTQSAFYWRDTIVQHPVSYANTILLTQNTDDTLTKGQQKGLDSFISMLKVAQEPDDDLHARVLTSVTSRELQQLMQRKTYDLAGDVLVMGYLDALHENGEAIWKKHTAEITSLIGFLEDDALRLEAQELFQLQNQSEVPPQAQPDELWLSFTGDITFNEDSFTILASPQQQSSFTIEERGGLGRKISSAIDYSQASEQTIAFAELEPWASAYLHELQAVLHSTATMLADDAMAFSTHQHIPSEWTHLPFDSYLFFSNYPQPLEGYTGVVFGTNPTEDTGDTGDAEPSDIAKQSFRNAAQLRAHGLIDDAALLAYFAEVAAHERMIPRETYGELELALSTFKSPSARQEAENVLQIILNPVIENIALTFAGTFTFQDDGVVIHYSQEKQSFFVIEEGSGAQRKYISNQDYARANDYFLPYEALEPWVRNILQDITPKLQQMVATISPTQPIKTAIDWGFSKQLRNYHNIDIIMNRNKNSLLGMHSILTDMPDEDITLLDFVLAVRNDLKQINQQRSHGAIRDTEVVAYLQAAQSNYPQLALELQADINSLNEPLPPEAQTEVRELFTFIDTPLHTNSAAEIEELLLATFAGNISFQGDALTLHAADASNEGAFLVLEEMGGHQRRYERRNPTASDITIRVSDLPRWARAALREIIASLPAQPTGEQGRSFYSNQLGYRYQIFFTDRQLALTPYQDAWTRDSLGMDSRLIGAHKLFYKVMQYHKHGLLEDNDVMDYLRAITAKNGTILGLFGLELEHLTRNLATEQREEAARLWHEIVPTP